MLRSFIVSTITLTCPLPSATLFVPVTVPLVYKVIALVDVPEAAIARSGVKANCACAAMSNAFLASFFSTLLITSLTGCADRSSSLPV